MWGEGYREAPPQCTQTRGVSRRRQQLTREAAYSFIPPSSETNYAPPLPLFFFFLPFVFLLLVLVPFLHMYFSSLLRVLSYTSFPQSTSSRSSVGGDHAPALGVVVVGL